MTPVHPSTALEDLRRFGQFLVDQASPATAQLVARGALATHRPVVRRRQWVVVLTANALLSTSTVALGTVADSAAPGDLLYGVDRGIETVTSIFGGGDHSGERIDEAEALLHQGDLPRAVFALGEAVDAHDSATAQVLVAASGELSAAETTATVEELVADLVAGARHVVAAAQSGDHDALKAAIAAMQDRTSDLTTAADPSGITSDNPSVTAPGQVDDNDNPGVTAPGQTNGTDDSADNPSVTAPGQTDGNENGNANGNNDAKDNPSVTAPGQGNGNGNGNGHGNGQP